MSYRTYSILGKTAFARGKKLTQPRNSTICELKKRGVIEIVWRDGSFMSI